MSRSLLIGALLFIAAPAMAQPLVASGGPPPKPLPGHHVSQLFMSPAGESFRAYPEDPYPVEAWFKQADTDKDGSISLAEFKADAVNFFHKLDRNDDGFIDDGENSYYEKSVAPEILETIVDSYDPGKARAPVYERGPDGSMPTVEASGSRIRKDRPPVVDAGAVQSRRGAARFSFLNEPQPVRAGDTNLDFRVSLKEWEAAASRRFAALDLNHDGKLERSELPQTPFQMRLSAEKRHK